MPPYKLFTFIASSWLMGVGIGELRPLSFFILYILFLVAALLYIATKKYSKTKFIFLLFGVMILGSMYSLLRAHGVRSDMVDYFNGKRVEISGIVNELPDIRDTHQKIIIDVISIDDAESTGKLLVLLQKQQVIKYGDSIKFNCTLEAPEPIEDFAYDKYLARFSIYSIYVFPKEINLVSSGKKDFKMILFSFRSHLEKNIIQSIPEPEASLLKGILLGDKKGMGEELTEIFRRTGLSHIVALSGYNISVLVAIGLALGPYIFLSRRILFFVITISIISFVIMTGASPSVIRAGFMGWLILLAYESRRIPHSVNILLATALIMVMINPKILVWDVGWQLSFLATFAMLEIVPEISYRFRFLPKIAGVRDAIIMTFSAIIITAPLIIWHFGGISVIAIFANLFIVPVIPLSMIGGFITGLFGNATPFSFLWTLPAWATLTYMIRLSSLLASLPFSYVNIPQFLGTVFSVSLIFVFIYKFMKRKYALKAA